jgi:hypothetical protein
MAWISRTPMSGSRNRTHVGEWAELVGDDVPDRALREHTLEGATRDRDCEEWRDRLS